MEKSATFTFGRFSPPTTGHKKLVDTVVNHAKKERGDHFIFPSHSEDPKKNPLRHKDKVDFMHKFFPLANVESHEHIKNPIHALEHLAKKGYKKVTMIVGDDRVQAMHNLLHKTNELNGKPIKDLQIKSAGQRDPDSEGVEGMSASKMRDFAKKSDFNKFKLGVPGSNVTHAKELYKAVRKGMKLESFQNHFKALFLVGGPGSGKDFIINSALKESKLVELSLDKLIKAIAEQTNIEELDRYPSLIVNGNAENMDKIVIAKAVLENMGYETGMVFVHTSDEVSKSRNDVRVLRGSKTFSESVRREKYNASMENVHQFADMFTPFFLYDNSYDFTVINEETRNEIMGWLVELGEGVSEFLSGSHKNESAKKWLAETYKPFSKEFVKKVNAVPHQVRSTSPQPKPILKGYERVKEGGVWVLKAKKTVSENFGEDFSEGDTVKHYDNLHAEPGKVVKKESIGKLKIYHVRHTNGSIHKYQAHQLTREGLSIDDLFEVSTARANDNGRAGGGEGASDSPTENPATVMTRVLKPKKGVPGDKATGIAMSSKNMAVPPVWEAKEVETEKEGAQKFKKPKKKVAVPPPNFFDGRMGSVPSGGVGLTSSFEPKGKPLSEIRKAVTSVARNSEDEFEIKDN